MLELSIPFGVIDNYILNMLGWGDNTKTQQFRVLKLPREPWERAGSQAPRVLAGAGRVCAHQIRSSAVAFQSSLRHLPHLTAV